MWKNLRVVKIGMPTQSSLPCAVAIISDDIDISEMSKSWNFSCRQNISDGWMAVGMMIDAVRLHGAVEDRP